MIFRLILREGQEYAKSALHILQQGTEVHADENLRTQCFDELLSLKVHVDLTTGNAREGWRAEESDTKAVEVVQALNGGGLRVRHLVGSATLKCGVQLEILPKVSAGGEGPDAAGVDRAALMRMWQYAADLRLREDQTRADMGMASLPLHEWLVQRFINQVKDLLRRGIRFQYLERDENMLAARGRLLVAQNVRHNAFAPHRFFCRIEELSPNRPENRLIRSALAKVIAATTSDANRREAAQLAEHLHEVPPSHNVAQDFSRWQEDRLMLDYREIRATCHWILRQQGPVPVSGKQSMFGRFVRMNDVFERYVARWMQEKLASSAVYELIEQKSGTGDGRRSKTWCNWEGRSARALEPDILVYSRTEPTQCVAILDTKWKPTADNEDGSDRMSSGSDLYQMFAYARHWLAGGTKESKLIALVYPEDASNRKVEKVEKFEKFEFTNLNDVGGYSLRFRLPILSGGTWSEGLIGVADHVLLSQLSAPQ